MQPAARALNGAFLGSLAINYSVTGLVAIAYLVVTLPDPPVLALTTGAGDPGDPA